jgi:hypothetical protein
MPQVQTTGFQPLAATLPGPHYGKERGAVQRALRDGVAEALDVEAKGHGVHGLAVSIRDRLAAAGTGNEAVSGVMETIQRALDDVATKLAAQGVSQDQIDAGVTRFRNKLARELSEMAGSGDVPADQGATEKSAIAAREVVRERFSLDVTTAEGDKITIRFKSLNVTKLAAAQVSRDGVTATAVEANVISRGRFQVAVDGDLNEAERLGLANLLDKADDIATDFFGGDVQAAFSAAARVSLDSEALSAFDLKLSYSRSLAAAQAYASNAKPGSQPVVEKPIVDKPVLEQPKSPVTTDPVISSPQTETAAPASAIASSDLTPVGETTQTAPETPPAIEGTATSAAVAHNTAKMASALETITQFAKDVLERLDSEDESKAAKFSLRWKVEFMIKAFGSVALTPIEQKAADALGIALDANQPGA